MPVKQNTEPLVNSIQIPKEKIGAEREEHHKGKSKGRPCNVVSSREIIWDQMVLYDAEQWCSVKGVSTV